MSRIKWCLKQGRGLALTEEKPRLAESYLKEADETLELMLVARGRWKTVMAYYTCYNALYALLMRCGIKSRIHDCTIAAMGILGFSKDKIRFMEELKEKRIQAQYYLKEIVMENEQAVKEFVAECKLMIAELTPKKIGEVRSRIIKEESNNA